MKFNTVLLDFDGVINKLEEYFSVSYSKRFNVSLDTIEEFFEGDKYLTNIGKVDTVDVLINHIDKWNWKGTIEEFIQYWQENENSELDYVLIKYLIEFRKGNKIKYYLVTDQDRYRGEYIWNELKLRDWMDGKFISYELGHEKKEPEFFTKVLKELKINPDEIVYFDDSQSKIDSAKSVGIENSYLYKYIDDIKNVLEN